MFWTIAILAAAQFVACGGTQADKDKDKDRPPLPDTAAPEDSGDPPADLALGIKRLKLDRQGLADMSLEVATYSVGPRHPDYTPDNEGNPPVFHVIRPSDADPNVGPRPALVWLHGGVKGVDDDPDRNLFCSAEGVADIVEHAIYDHTLVLQHARDRDWLVIVPETTWCDLWAGLGDDDPVDTNHRSIVHVHHILDALEVGFDDMSIDPGQVYAWGTSIGGAGVFPLAWGTGGPSRIQAMISDSGPVITTDWFDSAVDNDVVTHVLGGDPYADEEDTIPSEFWPNYARIDAGLLMSEHGFRVPVFAAFNHYDIFTDITHGEALLTSLNTHYGPDGTHFFYHDFNHRAPGFTYHTQTPFDVPPSGYTNAAAFRFLDGQNVQFFEAEDMCTLAGCRIADEDMTPGEVGERVSWHSQGRAVYAAGAQDAGTIFEADLPDKIPNDQPVELMFVVELTDRDDVASDAEILTITLWIDGGPEQTTTLTLADLPGKPMAPAEDMVQHMASTTVIPALKGHEPGTLPPETQLRVDFAGQGSVFLDGIWVLHP
jgi:hypothetical protein